MGKISIHQKIFTYFYFDNKRSKRPYTFYPIVDFTGYLYVYICRLNKHVDYTKLPSREMKQEYSLKYNIPHNLILCIKYFYIFIYGL